MWIDNQMVAQQMLLGELIFQRLDRRLADLAELRQYHSDDQF